VSDLETIYVCSGEPIRYKATNGLNNNIVPALTYYKWDVAIENPRITYDNQQNLYQEFFTGTTSTALISDSNIQQEVIYNVTPQVVGGCTGNPFKLTVVVDPTPKINDQNPFEICSGSPFTVIPSASVGEIIPSGTSNGVTYNTTYTWTVVDNPNVEGESNQGIGQNSISQTLTNTSTTVQTVTYTVRPTSTNSNSQNSCQGTSTFKVIVRVKPLIIDKVISNATCPGASDGSISITPSGNTGPYTYLWTAANGGEIPANMQNAANLTGIKKGSYTVKVTDSNGCEKSETFVITEPAQLVVSEVLANRRNILCFGEATGNITVEGTGGTKQYTFNLTGTDYTGTAVSLTSGPTNNASFSFATLRKGQYFVTLTDLNNCQSSTSVISLTQPASQLALTQSQVNNTCFGGNTGSISITPTGGTAPYTYAWTGPNGFTSTTEDLQNLVAGTYQVTVRDANACTALVGPQITINEPTQLALTQSQVNNVCFGGSIGSISITPSGGTAPYTYAWTGPNSFTSTTKDLSALVAGTYQVTVRDANSCAPLVGPPIIITEPAQLTLTQTQVNNVCFGGSIGSISITPSGGTAPYTYAWTGPNGFTSTNEDLQNLVAGTYQVTVRDANNCTALVGPQITVTQPTQLALTQSQVNNVCFGGNTGSISITPSGGTAPYTFAWTGPNGFTSTNEDLQNLVAGTYQVTVTDANACAALVGPQITITQPTQLALSQSQVNNVCFGGNTGSISITPSGGTAPYTYSWTGPNGFTSTNEDLQNLVAGTYQVTVTDANSCTALVGPQITITQPTQLALSQSQVNNVCFGGSIGSINISASGGTAPYTYSWTGPNGFTSTNEDLQNLVAGTYQVTVRDANACTALVGPQITITQPTQLALTQSQVNNVCFGRSIGSINISASGGTAPYTYAWTGPNGFTSTNEDLQNLVSGTYQVTVTDANSCTALVGPQITITQPTQLALTQSQVNNVCFGGNSGSISITPSGGTAPYTYSWTGPNGFTSTNEDLQNLLAGTYQVTVTDANACAALVGPQITITQPTQLALTQSQVNNICFGGSIGSISITPTGGTAPYTYAWTGPNGFTSTNEDLQNLVAGTYQVTVSDANNCTAVGPQITITQPTQLALTQSQVNNICFGGNTGSISITPSGGTAPYTYAWMGPNGFTSTTEDLQNLAVGTYQVTVTDANSCAALVGPQITITQPAQLALTQSQVNNTCFGGNTGSISITPSGGTAPYTYAWIGPNGFTSSNEDLQNLVAGTYQVTVRDANNCTAAGPQITITQPTQLALTQSQVNNVCFGGNTGSISITPSGGTTPYTYAWTGPNGFTSTNEDIQNLVAGTYQVTVTDANACAALVGPQITITQPTQLALTQSQVNNVCFGGSIGGINISASGGTAPYTYAWTGPNGFTSTNEDLQNLVAGTYQVTLTDANACAALVGPQITITQPTQLALTQSQVNNVCFGGSIGSISITPTGGTAPYSYAWIGPNGFTSTNEDIQNLVAGTYQVTVRDANNCTALVGPQITITEPVQPPQLVLSQSQVNNVCFGGSIGSISITPSGGTAPYTYSWTGPNGFTSTNKDIQNLVAGTYQVTVRDANACTTLVGPQITITQPTQLALTQSQVNNICFGGSIGSINISASGGTAPYTFAWTGPNGFTSTNEDLQNLAAGTYQVTVRDANNCTALVGPQITITQPTQLALTQSQVNNVCFGGSIGSINISASGGTAPYTYAWTGPNGFTSTTEDLQNLVAGTYQVTVTDANACAALVGPQITITQPAQLALTQSQVNNTCFGGNTGSISITPSGGTAPYTYSWTGPNGFTSTNEDIQNLVAGTYQVTVTDANACAALVGPQITITQPTQLTLTQSQVNNLCFGGNTGSISITPSGGTAPYTYAWTGPNGFTSTNEDIQNLVAGTYQVTVRDANACTAIGPQITITQPAQLALTQSQVNNVCFGGNSGSISITPTGGTAPYTYAWTGPNGFTSTNEDLQNLVAGTYQVTVRDANNCTALVGPQITVTQPTQLALTQSQVNNVCFGGSIGSINISASGGTAPYTYAWTGPNGFTSTNEDLQNLAAGTYQVTVRDANNCTALVGPQITITQPVQPPQLVLSQSQVNNVCFGGSIGSISITPSGGTAPYTYSWTGPNGFTSTNKDLQNLVAGTYQVTVRDANACTTLVGPQITITQPAQLALTQSQVNNVCFGGSIGSISITPSGGTAPYTYAWTGPNGFTSTNEDLQNLAAGTYQVTVRDANNCTAFVGPQITITQPSQLALTQSQVNNVCFGGNTASISITPSGGTAPYTYLWTATNGGVIPTNLQTAASLTGIKKGSYTVKVTDSNGCEKSESFIITEPTQLVLNEVAASRKNILCFGEATGNISVEGTGGTKQYTYSLTGTDYTGATVSLTSGPTNLNLFSFATLKAGQYVLSLTDLNGCQKSVAPITLTQPLAPLQITNEVLSNYNGLNIACFGDTNASISLQVSGGTAPYRYSWTGPNGFSSTSSDLSNLAVGSYNLIITDAVNCTFVKTYEMRGPDPIGIAATISNYNGFQISCKGASDGVIDLNITGGNGGYQIFWEGPGGFRSNLSKIEGLLPGKYEVTVIDSKNCTLKQEYILLAPDEFLISPDDVKVTEVSCFNGSNGAIAITIKKATLAPYRYEISGNSSTGLPVSKSIQSNNLSYQFTGLRAGSYTLRVSDAVGCTVSVNATIKETAIFDLTETVKNVSCLGKKDGAISLRVIGGSPPFKVQWAHGPKVPSLNNLDKGIYSVLITDTGGCSIEKQFVITEPQALDLSATVTDALDCVDQNTGSISVNPFGGTPPYTYTWSNGSKTQNLSAIGPGSYSLELVDANGCRILRQFTVNHPLPLEVGVAQTTVRVCEPRGLKSNFKVTVKGGIAPYTVTWNRGTQTNAGLVMDTQELGVFVVTVKDARGCIQIKRIEVLETDPLIAEFDYTSASFDLSKENLVNFEVQFKNLSAGKFKEASWDFGDGVSSTAPDPTHKYVKAGTYLVQLKLKDLSDCIVSFSKEIVINDYYLKFPTGFSPNQDGINDYFYPKFLHISAIHVIIMNKWGELVYETKDIDAKGWDGLYKGEKAAIGNYVCKVRHTTLDGRVIDQSSVFYLGR
jgi:gliding motility-associated-like protein